MGLLDLFRTPLAEAAPSVPLAEHVAAVNDLEIVRESLAGLEQLTREDAGWRRLGMEQEQQFTRSGLLTIHAACLAAAIKSPLIGRGLRIRRHYVWGQGVDIAAREVAEGDTALNDLIQGLLDSPEYVRALGSAQAREEREMDLGVRGEFFLLAVHDDTNRTVRPRLVPAAQVVDYISNPEDLTDVWFYKRQWTANRVNLITGATERSEQTEWHPVLAHRPAPGLRVPLIGGKPVRWDAPIQHCAVNSYTDACWGLPDCYAAIDWARAYAEFLTQWAVLMRALSRYAWRTTAPGANAAKIKAAVANGTGVDPITGQPVGGTAVMSTGATLEAIPKSGATIDSQSGKPLAGMAAAALDVPLTMLLADPGSTGARAVAETLDRPLELTTGSRRNIWTDWLKALFSHVIGMALEDGVLAAPADADLTVDVTWPPISETDPSTVMDSIVKAESTGLLPPLLLVRLMLQALGVEDVDEVMDDLTDDDGNFIDPEIAAAAARVQREQNGAPGSQAAEAYR